jgi:hypothetical protein
MLMKFHFADTYHEFSRKKHFISKNVLQLHTNVDKQMTFELGQ